MEIIQFTEVGETKRLMLRCVIGTDSCSDWNEGRSGRGGGIVALRYSGRGVITGGRVDTASSEGLRSSFCLYFNIMSV